MFAATDAFDRAAMQQFMARPEIYWPTRDALSPPPEMVANLGNFDNPEVWTMAATWREEPIGYVQFQRRTSICAEMQVAFDERMRGKVALEVCRFGIANVFERKGILKVIAAIPSDNRPALIGIRRLGFALEGRLTKAIVRQQSRWGPAGLYDILIWGLCKERA